MDLILVLDLGTSNTKATLFNECGTIVTEVFAATPILFDSDRMEIDQGLLWFEIKQLCSKILVSVPAGDRIAAVTVSSMACTMIPVDADGNSLHNALSWLEKRPYEKYTLPFLNRFIAGYAIAKCGQYPLTMYPAFKIPWFSDTYPEVSKKVFKWINIGDFIHSKLLGKTDTYYCDHSIASRSMLFDDLLKKWNPHALREFSIDESMLPIPLPAGTILGQVGTELTVLGFSDKTLVVLGSHDHICASVGAVINTPERVLHSTGTSEVLTTRFNGNDVTVPARCWLNVESSAYSADNLIVAFCCASGQIHKSFEGVFSCSGAVETQKLLSAYESVGRRPVFIPPIRAMLTSTTGKLLDIPGIFDSDDVRISLYEGFALECKRVLDRIETVSGTSTSLIRSVGGQTRNDGLTQLRSNILNREIERSNDSNITARGAFVIAAVSIGLYKDIIATAEYLYEKSAKDVFFPEKKAASRYQESYEVTYIALFEKGIYSI
ncbi:MAG: FGGY family carbohydrate kinase [Treponemataceae bacterium]